MKKILFSIAVLLSSTSAFAKKWKCVCTLVDDYGTCIAWECDDGENPIDAPTSLTSFKSEESEPFKMDKLLPMLPKEAKTFSFEQQNGKINNLVSE